MAEKKETKKNKLAVIELAGSQLLVEEGREYEIEHLNLEKGKKEKAEALLVIDGDKTVVGKPKVKGVTVEYEVVATKKGKKQKIFKYKAKARYRRTYGHRSDIVRIKVKKISTAK